MNDAIMSSAFTNPSNAKILQQQKILEELQQQKKMLKQGGGGGGGSSSSVKPEPTTVGPSSSATGIGGVTGGISSALSSTAASPASAPATVSANSVASATELLSSNQRAAAALDAANKSSFGYFIPQDSSFGNLILPVIPRIAKREDVAK